MFSENNMPLSKHLKCWQYSFYISFKNYEKYNFVYTEQKFTVVMQKQSEDKIRWQRKTQLWLSR